MAGSANVEGEWWGRRAEDWSALQESTSMPLYRAALEKLSIRPGTRVLDVGCGAGLFCQLAARRGAEVSGLDASEPLIGIARRRAPEARFFVGDMESLPFEGASFDVVTGFDSFPYAADPRRALAGAARVVRPGGTVFLATWGDAADCEASAYWKAVGGFLPPLVPGAPGPLAPSDPDALRALAVGAGLSPRELADVDLPFVYADLPSALRATLSAGPAARAIDRSGEDPVRRAVAEALAPFRLSSGGYRLENRCRYLVAEAA